MNLDVGCGHEPKHHKRRGHVGIDIKRGLCDIVCDVHHMPFKDNCFDTATAYEILEHTISPYYVLKEIRRVLKPYGELTLTVPNVLFIGRFRAALQRKKMSVHPEHLYCWNWEILENLLTKSGFETIYHTHLDYRKYSFTFYRIVDKISFIYPALMKQNLLVKARRI